MAAVPATNAATISIEQVLGLLDSQFESFAEAFASNQYTLWLGSGISRERVDDLQRLIEKVLSFLQQNIDAENASCPHLAALREALDLASLSPDEKRQIDYDVAFSTWPLKTTVLSRLVDNYSKLLDIRVRLQPPDYLLWNVVDVPATYSAENATPDCEHLCVALLAMEGVVGQMLTANWDGLIERALSEVTGSPDAVLRVCVLPTDLRLQPALSRLFKFHGCAVRAGQDPATYRHMLIARFSQISDWQNNPDYLAMRTEMISIASQKRTLMVGMSAQDINIQQVFGNAAALMPWAWPTVPPAYVFAEDRLGFDQRNILRVVYRGAYGDHPEDIDSGAHFRAFGKPLLTGLFLHVIHQKLSSFAMQINAPSIAANERTELSVGLRVLRDKVAQQAEPNRLEFIRSYIQKSGELLSVFREGRLPDSGHYRPVSLQGKQFVQNDPSIATSGIREISAAFGLLGLGERDGSWTVAAGADQGSIAVARDAGVTKVFFAANTTAALSLLANGVIDEDDESSVLVHSSHPIPRMPRAPSAAPGRTGRNQMRNVSMSELLESSASIADAQTKFREEAVL